MTGLRTRVSLTGLPEDIERGREVLGKTWTMKGWAPFNRRHFFLDTCDLNDISEAAAESAKAYTRIPGKQKLWAWYGALQTSTREPLDQPIEHLRATHGRGTSLYVGFDSNRAQAWRDFLNDRDDNFCEPIVSSKRFINVVDLGNRNYPRIKVSLSEEQTLRAKRSHGKWFCVDVLPTAQSAEKKGIRIAMSSDESYPSLPMDLKAYALTILKAARKDRARSSRYICVSPIITRKKETYHSKREGFAVCIVTDAFDGNESGSVKHDIWIKLPDGVDAIKDPVGFADLVSKLAGIATSLYRDVTGGSKASRVAP